MAMVESRGRWLCKRAQHFIVQHRWTGSRHRGCKLWSAHGYGGQWPDSFRV